MLSPTITGHITAQEYIAAGHLHRRRKVVLGYWISGILVLAGIVVFFAVASKPGFVLAGAGIGGAIGGFIESRLYLPWRLRQLYAQSKTAEGTCSCDDDKPFFSAENGQGYHRWADFRKAKENDELILLYINDVLYQIIAKHWFATASELESFKKHLKFVAGQGRWTSQ